MTTPPPLGTDGLSDEELQRLEAFLAAVGNETAMTLEGVDGLFCALIAGPDMVMPSEYLPIVCGGDLSGTTALADLDEANEFLGLLMRHWNSIIKEFDKDGVYVPLFDDPDERGVPGRRWARGYMRGVRMRHDGWLPLITNENEGQLITIPLVAGEVDADFPHEPVTAEQAKELEMLMAVGAARAYRHFLPLRRPGARADREPATVRRTAPKIGRNEPCPCGSGKKFKQCCGRGGAPSSSALH